MPEAAFSTSSSQKSATPEQIALREANMGIYCYRADLFWKHVAEIQPNNPAREYYLTDMPAILTRAGHSVEAMLIDDPGEALGINDRCTARSGGWHLPRAQARRRDGVGRYVDQTGNHYDRFRRRNRYGYHRGAVSPQILGKTTIAENCRIGRLLHRFRIRARRCGGGRRVHREVNTSVLEHDVHAGPYARLRMKNHVAAGAHIGNFVELKKYAHARRRQGRTPWRIWAIRTSAPR